MNNCKNVGNLKTLLTVFKSTLSNPQNDVQFLSRAVQFFYIVYFT
jgi:hypothetical protein